MLAASVTFAAGCGSAREVPSRWAGPAPDAAPAPAASRGTGSGSGLIFPADPSVVVADGSAAEFSRSDGALASSGVGARPLGFWPEQPAPSLDRRTTLFLGRSNESFVFFRERRRYEDPWRVYR
jgi:hypothetical protein